MAFPAITPRYFIACILLCKTYAAPEKPDYPEKEFCIIGAGPGGIQLGHYFNKAGYDYVIFEKQSTAGSFFKTLPLSGKLTSMNKRFPKNKPRWEHLSNEYRLRYDWNSLLDGDVPPMTERTTELWPNRQVLADYIEDFARSQSKNIIYDTTVHMITEGYNDTNFFAITENTKTKAEAAFTCGNVIMAHGKKEPRLITTHGHEHVVPYHLLPEDGEWAKGKRVAILGKGNAAFEVSEMIKDKATETVIIGRSSSMKKRSGMYGEESEASFATRKHADTQINMGFREHDKSFVRWRHTDIIERSQLNSMDSVIQYTSDDQVIFKCGGKLCVSTSQSEINCSSQYNITGNTVSTDQLRGAGVEISRFGGYVSVNGVEGLSKAYYAGVKKGDCFSKIDGRDGYVPFTPGTDSFKHMEDKMFGPKPWTIQLVNAHDGWLPVGVSPNKADADTIQKRLLKEGQLLDDEVRISIRDETRHHSASCQEDKEGMKVNCSLTGDYSDSSDKERKLKLQISPDGNYGKTSYVVEMRYLSIYLKPHVAEIFDKIRREVGESSPLRRPFDVVVSALGWTVQAGELYNSTSISPTRETETENRPITTDEFRSMSTPGIYFVGENMSPLRQASYISGFRYLAKAMFNRLNLARGVEWPHDTMVLTEEDMKQGAPALMDRLVQRWQSASAPFHMRNYLGDGVVFKRSSSGVLTAEYYEDIQLKQFDRDFWGHAHLMWTFTYGKDFYGDAVDVPETQESGYFAELSQSLHPMMDFHLGWNQRRPREYIPNRHYVREDASQNYNSSNHRFFLTKFMKTALGQALAAFK